MAVELEASLAVTVIVVVEDALVEVEAFDIPDFKLTGLVPVLDVFPEDPEVSDTGFDPLDWAALSTSVDTSKVLLLTSVRWELGRVENVRSCP